MDQQRVGLGVMQVSYVVETGGCEEDGGALIAPVIRGHAIRAVDSLDRLWLAKLPPTSSGTRAQINQKGGMASGGRRMPSFEALVTHTFCDRLM